MSGCLLLLLLPLVAAQVDQRQTGEYNVHISLKDVKIIALLGGGLGSEDYDYNYDYSDLTIKPSPGMNATTTTAKTPAALNDTAAASTTTEKVVEITPSPPSTASASTQSNEMSSTKPEQSDAILDPPSPIRSNLTLAKPGEIPVQVVFVPTSAPNSVITTTGKPVAAALLGNSTRADCIEGFFKDREGNCRPKQKKLPQQTLLRKLIQMSQRSHQANRN